MPTDLLAKWLLHYDPIHRGWTPAGIANGVCTMNGLFFPRIRGGYNLRRCIGGVPNVPNARDPIVGAAACDATTVRTFPWITHEPGVEYTYRLTPLGGGGIENLTDEVLAATGFDPAGNWLGARPNAPADLRVTPSAGGGLHVQWTYSPEGQQVEPAEFRLYHDGGSGHVNFAAPAATVPYRPGRFHFEHMSEPFAHGLRITWAVRAATAAGVEEPNQRLATGRAEALPPAVNPAVVVSVH